MQSATSVTIGRGEDSIELPVIRTGKGPKALFLGGAEPMRRSGAWLEELSRSFDVMMPIHPGFGGSNFVPHIRKPADLAMLYLSLLDQLGGSSVVIGSSFGGWIAAEMATRSCQRIDRLVLIDSLGFKFAAGPSETEVLDLYSSSPADVKAALYHDPTLRDVDLSTASDALLAHIVQDRTAETYYGWSPYMHSPDLHRWLHRIACPTLVLWGEHDGIVSPSYGRRIAKHIPNAGFQIVPRAAHHPHIENLGSVLGFIQEFTNAR
jgi:pimeloyl-ACP methyl ester carboxylesterase